MFNFKNKVKFKAEIFKSLYNKAAEAIDAKRESMKVNKPAKD